MPANITHLPSRLTVRVLGLRRLSDTGFALTLERRGLVFAAGQLVNIHGSDLLDDRSYTICNGEKDENLTVLFRLIPSGKLTPRLAMLGPGDTIEISGPYGEFTVRDPARKMFFIATGTGIAPARAYRRTHANLNMTLLHGVRTDADLFYRDEFTGMDYRPCVSGGSEKHFHGRVTDLAKTMHLPADAHYYLCGANEMFYDMRDVLTERGVPPAQIFTEAYYYRADD